MTTAVIVHQHTNNFGDDAAGAALAEQLIDTLGVDHVDVFYIWQKDGTGIPLPPKRFTNHLIPELSGSKDMRAPLTMALVANALFRWRLPAWLRFVIATAQGADYVFVSPAGANIGIYKDWTYLLVLLALVRNGVRPIFHLNTIGESNSSAFNRVARAVLRRSDLNVRELASADWLASKKMSAYLGVDTAVLLNATGTEPITHLAEPYLAVVPTGLANWHRDFRQSDDSMIHGALVRAVAHTASARDLRVVLVPHLYGPEDESDLLAGLRLALIEAGCRAEVATVVGHQQYLSALSGARATISMRYHGLVLSAIAGVPCVSIAYENKMVEAAAYLGVPDLCCDSRADATELGCLLDRALDASDDYAREAATRISALRDIALGPIRSARARSLRDPSGGRVS